MGRNDSVVTGDAAGGDHELNELVSEYVDRMNAGEKLDPQQVLEQHPRRGPEILEELQVFLDIDEDEWAVSAFSTVGDFRLIRQVGRGGMGVVYEAWQTSMDRRVALKVLPAGIAADGKAFSRFMREAKTAGKLNHRNVVSVHAMGVHDATPYFAMEFVDGETLAQILRRLRAAHGKEEERIGVLQSLSRIVRRGSGVAPALEAERSEASGQRVAFDADEVNLQYCLDVARAFAGVADGLQHAHAEGVVHRDIKPSNLIFDLEGHLRILDFGVARLEGQESLTGSGDLVGTPLYMSPEQAQVRKIPVDHRTDLYSLGATMYEMLAWKPPFRGKDHQDTLSQIIARDPQPLRRHNPRIPKDLETVVLKCLRKDPADRYGSAEALAQDLRRFVRGDAVEARPQSRWEKIVRRARYRRGRLAAAGVIAALVVSVVWLGLNDRRNVHLLKCREYDALVSDALMKLHRSELTYRAAAGKAVSINTRLMLDRSDLLVVGERGLNPVEEALSELERAIESMPERVDARYYRARALILLGHDRQALEELDRAVRYDRDFLPVRVLREELADRLDGVEPGASREAGGWQGWWLEAYTAAKERRWQDAAAAYGNLIAMDGEGERPYLGSSMEARLGRGFAFLEGGDYLEAVNDFSFVTQLWPGFLEVSLLLGKAYYLGGQREWAEATFRRLHARAEAADQTALWIAAVYKSMGDYEQAYAWGDRLADVAIKQRLRSIVLICMGRRREAAEAGREAIRLAPDGPLAHVACALALGYNAFGRRGPKFTEEYHEFNRIADRAIELAPDNPLGYCIRAQTVASEEDALAYFRKAAEYDPTGYNVHHFMAQWYYGEGEYEKLIPICRRAIELARDVGLKWTEALDRTRLGIALYFQHNEADAVAQFEEAIRAEPTYAGSYLAWGMLLYDQKRYDEALEKIDAALAREPHHRSYRYRAWVLRKQQRFDEALEALNESIRQADDAIESYYARGLTYEDTGDLKSAIRDHCKVLELNLHHGRSRKRIADLVPRLLREASAPELVALAEVAEKIGPAVLPISVALATVDLVAGDTAGAIRRLERPVRLFRAWGASRRFLTAVRRAFPSVLASCATIDALLDTRELDREENLVGSDEMIAYLKARMRQRAGAYREAAELFEELTALVPAETEPHLRYAECLCALGEPKRAAEYLGQVLAQGASANRGLWDRWLAICFDDLDQMPSGVRAELPPHASDYGADIRWLLEQLDRGAVRINCGGTDYRRPGGESWGKDRFYRGGRPGLKNLKYQGDIAGTEDDGLYRSERWFEAGEPCPSYHIPLPRGNYRVTLHFAEMYFRDAGSRRFSVALEGRRVLEAYEPGHKGFAVADVHGPYDVEVTDGTLDLEFIPDIDNPKISAIELETVE
jgi:serine/threonine protein kinase/tetratricopeptide (TPR) repeat protein